MSPKPMLYTTKIKWLFAIATAILDKTFPFQQNFDTGVVLSATKVLSVKSRVEMNVRIDRFSFIKDNCDLIFRGSHIVELN